MFENIPQNFELKAKAGLGFLLNSSYCKLF